MRGLRKEMKNKNEKKKERIGEREVPRKVCESEQEW